MKKVLLAFSGSLDDLVCLHWLRQVQGYRVIAFIADLGQQQALEKLGELALETGAESTIIADLQDVFLEKFAFPSLQAGAHYEDYKLSTPLARYALSEQLVQIAIENNLQTIAHGSSIEGNDQVRMQAALAALSPSVEVLAPMREMAPMTHAEKLKYLQQHRLPIREGFEKESSVDRNIWGCSQVLTRLEGCWQSPSEEDYVLTCSTHECRAEPEEIVIEFHRGRPIGLQGKATKPRDLLHSLNKLGAAHGIGRLDHFENRLLGDKSRELYEAPGATILYQAHKALEEVIHSRELGRYKRFVAEEYGQLVYQGLWFSELREALNAFVTSSQRYVSGKVRLELFRGHAVVQGRDSEFSLYGRKESLAKKKKAGLTKGYVETLTEPGRHEARLKRKHPRK